MAEESGESAASTSAEIKKKKKKGVLSTLWNAVFRARGDDFEKRLQHITKEESTLLARIARRSKNVRIMTRNLIISCILCEVIATGYAIMTTRSPVLNWKTRALRVLPIFLVPTLFFIAYSALRGFSKMRDQKDHRTLENLKAERQAKINELKEKTNYYITQQLIQRYDPDPAAKAAAATVLASKLGADSGLKVYLGDNVDLSAPSGRSNDVEVARPGGLRNRKQLLSRSTSMDSGSFHHHPSEEGNLSHTEFEGGDPSQKNPLVVEHRPQTGSTSNSGGWIARLAALLVGEDPTQSFALICGNCHMHNGLARKEDFPYITYYCPHCQALNRPKNAAADDTHIHEGDSPNLITTSLLPVEDDEDENPSHDGPFSTGKASDISSHVARAAVAGISES